MNNQFALNILAETFSRLNNREKANLRWHADHKTKLCCGEQARYYSIDNAA